jgi:glyoxylase-like metal-dependent hydrolase (beta-lactamase superfamily II)
MRRSLSEEDTSVERPRLQRHPDGITAVDTEYVRPGLAAAHVIAHGGRAAFVDTGTTHSVPYLLAALDELGIAWDMVDYVLLTHVHLDHAGGAGRLMQALPQARAVIHPRGAPHMIDPTKLIAGSIAVYGEAVYRELYGELVPIPAERVVTTTDGQRLSLAGRELEFVHTPGHALHHHAIVDLAHRSIFTGDTFGLSYRELDTENGPFIVPTTTPTQFDPERLIESLDRLLGYGPQALYLTHYSRVTEVPRLAESLKLQIREFVRIARGHRDAANRHEAISADMRGLWLELLRRHGCTLSDARIDELLGGDLELNTQGLIVWLDRERKS